LVIPQKENIVSPNKKVFLTVLTFVLAMAVIACSCSSLIPTITNQLQGTQPPANQLPTTLPPSNQLPAATQPPSSQETMPGLAGTWHDPDTNDEFVIAWQNSQYVVTSVSWEGTSYSITSQSWSGSSLSWSYLDTTLNLTVTHTTTSLSGDTLNANWSYSDGSSGTETLLRGGASAVQPTIAGSQETMPGLAGTWQDPQTKDTFEIAWVNNEYVVQSVVWETTTYNITSQSWLGGSLTWSYYIPDTKVTLSYQTTSISGDSLYTNWWNDLNNSGTETLGRLY
jgi:hypothetical protein